MKHDFNNGLCSVQMLSRCIFEILLLDIFLFSEVSNYQYNTQLNPFPGEPDNWNNIEKCAKMLSQYHDGSWSDQSCDALYSQAYFVCNMTTHAQPRTTYGQPRTTRRLTTHTLASHKTTRAPATGQGMK